MVAIKDGRNIRIIAWGALFVVSLVATIYLSVFLAVNIVGNQIKSNECTALELLTNPSAHIQNPQFLNALIVWERGDRCV